MSESTSTDGQAVRMMVFRGAGFAPQRRPAVAAAAIASLLAAWQGASAMGWIDAVVLPSPSNILAVLWRLLSSGTLGDHLLASLLRLGTGWSVGAAAGVLVGLCLGLHSAARSIGVPLVSALFTIPKVALLPLFIVWFGIGEGSKISIIAFGVFFPTVISTYGAVDGVSQSLIRMAQSFDVRHLNIVRKVVLPAALPGILSGFRVSVSIGIILLVTAEMIGADKGMGAFILAAGNLYQVDQLLAGVVVLSTLGIALSSVITLAEAKLLAWR